MIPKLTRRTCPSRRDRSRSARFGCPRTSPLGPNGEIVGIEILDASERLDFEKGKPLIELENIGTV
ncbi:MAG: hypothetical protein Kow0099_21050 [Candidatus Abyssubacteria bacterium]